ncbi:MAG: F0F1 ATP synthase subunit delta [Methylotenera sp.]|jgi:F-type H+-transporting ATPase subunit delta|uniref:ATP synthase subunit delta n=1 Tax=Methylotenera mobilis TaxID=359408 RepID=A0A351RB25_9PROT|nr:MULTISPECIES: F0F1 ATP synthase subunit delta [Methylotenera]HBA09246.1 F0F1 ATP synthase subunit delta [Methylotenera mobilis]MDP3211240.1 F0F1 ATP synthase subunit delta [Methylotenera sp.]MDP3777930.1 F0F1 ATP synthase subunit delta [Methylotenera sp.]PPC91911.1 MAG: F0F1 ATP synthase subunit delta [Methylotenera sp.]PPC96848.1 MAG: F0F1 ATP synthase subunit delta [Methylotenera sp.]
MAEISTIARPYAVAAYKLGREQKALGKWSEMLGFAAAVANDAQIKAYIQDPKVVSSDLQTTFLKVCGDQLNENGQNLVKVLVEYGRLSILPEISSAFEALKAQDEGTLDAEIIAAAKPSAAEVKDLVKRLEAKFGKKIEASVSVDPELIGGIKIIVGDTVIDASVKGQLQNLAYTLTA